MLGAMKRTSRLDVALAIIATGLSFLAWALVSGIGWVILQQQDKADHVAMPGFLKAIQVFSDYAGYVLDIMGLIIMCICLLLIFLAHRQVISMSWAWLMIVAQLIFALLIGVFVITALLGPQPELFHSTESLSLAQVLSMISLPVVIATAAVVWSVFAFYMYRQPKGSTRRRLSLADSVKTNWK